MPVRLVPYSETAAFSNATFVNSPSANEIDRTRLLWHRGYDGTNEFVHASSPSAPQSASVSVGALDSKSIGNLLSTSANFGLAHLRLEALLPSKADVANNLKASFPLLLTRDISGAVFQLLPYVAPCWPPLSQVLKEADLQCM